jgi:hypothetical protein
MKKLLSLVLLATATCGKDVYVSTPPPPPKAEGTPGTIKVEVVIRSPNETNVPEPGKCTVNHPPVPYPSPAVTVAPPVNPSPVPTVRPTPVPTVRPPTPVPTVRPPTPVPTVRPPTPTPTVRPTVTPPVSCSAACHAPRY